MRLGMHGTASQRKQERLGYAGACGWKWEALEVGAALPTHGTPTPLPGCGAVRWVTRSVAAGQSAGEGRLRKYVTDLQLQRGLRLGARRAVRLLLLLENGILQSLNSQVDVSLTSRDL